MTYSVRFWRRDFGGVLGVAGAPRFEVRSLSWASVGGPDTCVIDVVGLGSELGQGCGWLRCPVVVYDGAGVAVWWGFVESVAIGERAVSPAVTVGLGDLVNTVAVVYPRATPSGVSSRGETGFASDAASVAEYGTRARRVSLAAALSDAGALAARGALLASAALPAAELAAPGVAPGAAVIRCRGWWWALDWEYYGRADGRAGVSASGLSVEMGHTTGALGVAQQLRLPAGMANWITAWFAVRVRKVGAPADQLRVSINADNGGVPGGEMGRYDLTVSDAMAWRKLDVQLGLSSGATSAWLVFTRTSGAADPNNYYQVAGTRDGWYWQGSAYGWAGAWAPVKPTCQLTGVFGFDEDAATQLGRLVAGQFVTAVDVVGTAGVTSCPWRDGDRTRLQEIEELLSVGLIGGTWRAYVTPERRVTVEPIPAAAGGCLILGQDGRLYGLDAELIRRDAAVYARWLKVSGCEWLGDVGWVGAPGPVWIERCEIDVKAGVRRLTPRAVAVTGADFGKMRPFVTGWAETL